MKNIPDSLKIYELSRIWKEAAYNFAFWDKVDIDWDAEYRKALERVLATDNAYDYYRELKRFLALLKYLYGLKGGEYVRRDTLVKALGGSGEKIDKALEYLMSIRGNHRNDPVVSISVVNEGGQAETAYGINMTQGGLLFSLLAVADEYVHAPCGYKNQIMNREKPWA